MNHLSILYKMFNFSFKIILFVFLALISCQTNHHQSTATPRHDFQKNLMGTTWEITIITDDFLNAKQVAKSAFYEIERIEKRFSSWIENTEISKINREAGQFVEISKESYDHLKLAQSIAQETQGAFDVTWASLQGLWDFRAKKIPPHTEILARLQFVGSQKHLQLKQENALYFAQLSKGARIELGAITKGYAVDQASQIIEKFGFQNFIVNGGGDLKISGHKEDQSPWRIGIRHPRNGKIFGEIQIDGTQSIVSSGDYERYFIENGQIYHHIIDLRTGYPAQASVSVTVVAPTAVLADAYATALFVLGPKASQEILNQHPEIQVVFLTPSGEVLGSPKLLKQLPSRWY